LSGDKGSKIKVENIRKVSSILINRLNPFFAHSHFQTYNTNEYNLGINLTYKYIVFNVVGKSIKMKKYSFELIDVE